MIFKSKFPINFRLRSTIYVFLMAAMIDLSDLEELLYHTMLDFH